MTAYNKHIKNKYIIQCSIFERLKLSALVEMYTRCGFDVCCPELENIIKLWKGKLPGDFVAIGTSCSLETSLTSSASLTNADRSFFLKGDQLAISSCHI